MPATIRAMARRNENAADAALLADHGRLAQLAGLLIVQATSSRGDTRFAGGSSVIPNERSSRQALGDAIWQRVLRPYYIGATGEALRNEYARGDSLGITPQSPYAERLTAGVRGAVRVQAERQAALIRRHIGDPGVVAWLTEGRPTVVQETLMDSFSQWVDPAGFMLADRILRTAVGVRARVNRFLDYHIGRGTPAGEMTAALGQFLTTGERQRRPYGQQGGYAARLLLRNEVIVAGGWATLNASQVNPVVGGIQWQLTRADDGRDRCDLNSRGGPNGDGVYAPADVPPWPDHVGEQCILSPVATSTPAAVTAALRAAIDAATGYAQALRGVFNVDWLTEALLSGAFGAVARRLLEAAREIV
jgi:hypothetical protein